MKRPRVTDVVLGLLCLMYFVTYLDRVNISSAAAGFSADFGLNKTEIGLVFSAFAYPYLVFQVIGGWISDRYGARRTLIACGLVWGGATFPAATIDRTGNWQLPFVGSMVLMGVGVLLAYRMRPDSKFEETDLPAIS